MLEIPTSQYPTILKKLQEKGHELGFTMSCDDQTGSFLRTLVASKANANILELGTGVGVSLAWIIDEMDQQSRVITVDNDTRLTDFVKEVFRDDQRVSCICQDGADWINTYTGDPFDLIFADAWPGKFSDLEATLNLVKAGGIYFIDDLSPASDWPEGHREKVVQLIQYLENREDFTITKMDWSTGLIMAVRSAVI